MKNENIGKMVASILNNDKDEFSDSFSAEMRDRLASNVSDNTLDVSKKLTRDMAEIIQLLAKDMVK